MKALPLLIPIFLMGNCSKNNETTTKAEVPAVYKKIYGATDMYVDGDYVIIKSNGLPDHKSVYYEGTQWQSTLYQAYNGDNPSFAKNPHQIAQQNYTFKIPLNPKVSSAHSATPLGPIGVSLNGVPFFNQYAGNNQPLGNEKNSFDQYLGHPAPGNDYHYHQEPLFLTQTKGNSVLLGFLLDGFPVYGPYENGVMIKNDVLDSYHGHSSITADYPAGIYHYHITNTDPYINGSGFYGTPGTVSK